MKKAVVLTVALALVFAGGCRKRTRTEVVNEAYDVRFSGVKTAVKVKAEPEQIEKYLLDPHNLVQADRNQKLKLVSGKAFTGKGDKVVLQSEAGGEPLSISLVLLKLEPGKGAELICLFQESILGFYRYQMKKLDDGTKLTLELEVEDENPLVQNSLQKLNLKKLTAELQNDLARQIQVHFDPALQMETIADASEGEPYEKLFQARRVAVWINASPAKVSEYMTSPAFSRVLLEKYNSDYGQAFIQHQPGIYPAGSNFLGAREEYDLALLAYHQDQYSISYLTAKLPSCIRIITAPERNGTRLTLAYMTLPPSAFTAEVANLLTNALQIPRVIERALLDIKAAVEGSG